LDCEIGEKVTLIYDNKLVEGFIQDYDIESAEYRVSDMETEDEITKVKYSVWIYYDMILKGGLDEINCNCCEKLKILIKNISEELKDIIVTMNSDDKKLRQILEKIEEVKNENYCCSESKGRCGQDDNCDKPSELLSSNGETYSST